MIGRKRFLVGIIGSLFFPALAAPQSTDLSSWSEHEAEHLWNRAGFGASEEEIQRAVESGPQAFVAELLAGRTEVETPFHPRSTQRESRERMRELAPEERKHRLAELRREEKQTIQDFLAWWVERVLSGSDPLVERMTLFWHGHFTSSMSDVKNARDMIEQNQLFRRHALGSFRELLHAIARDPAMLEYLDNDVNRRGNPNENFARELLELFTLGEGKYGEEDVKEAARAFTGWTEVDGEFQVQRRNHDHGEKTVLGVRGRLDGDDVLEILLAHEACPRFLAGKLLVYFEGVEPSPERLERYARVLRQNDYQIGAFLKKLFLDPGFYREEVVGQRITSPLDFLAGSARRLGIDPPARLVAFGAEILGQKLFFPPNVKGWEGGPAWITTAALMQRGNLAGVLLGEVSLRDFLEEERPRVEGFRELRSLGRMGWRPRFKLSERVRSTGLPHGAEMNEGIVDALARIVLAVELEPDSRAHLARFLEQEHPLLEDSDVAEPILRRLAHLMLSLPEGQLD